MRPGPDGPDPDFRREACLGVCLCVRGVFLPGFVLTVPNVCISPAGDRHAILTFFSGNCEVVYTPAHCRGTGGPTAADQSSHGTGSWQGFRERRL